MSDEELEQREDEIPEDEDSGGDNTDMEDESPPLELEVPGTVETPEEEEVFAEPAGGGSAPRFTVVQKAGEKVGKATGGTLGFLGSRLRAPTEEANGDDLSDLFQAPLADNHIKSTGVLQPARVRCRAYNGCRTR